MTTAYQYQDYPIEVSARILRHISRGIYRTPAGALKELVSNAYDAGAKKVTINTGYPTFKEMIVTDNGKGMSRDEFIAIIQNIGLSGKQAGHEFKIPGSNQKRITIGHYGIGVLAIGQLCEKVTITSKTEGTLEGFEAILDFEQFEIKKINGLDRALIKDEKDIEKEDSGKEKFPIGKCTIRSLKYAPNSRSEHFTKLKLEVVRVPVQKKLSGSLLKEYEGLDVLQRYSANFQNLLILFRKEENDIRQGQYPYEKLCWEIATYSPVKYPNIGVFIPGQTLSPFKKLAEDYRFEVIIDGFEVTKPFEEDFFRDSNYPIKYIFHWENETYTKGKKVSGYLIYKQHIRPRGMQGVLVREAGIAIGMYDLTFLEYPFHEGTKFEQLTGELFVEGLSGALNIDRNSFNETDDYYIDLVKWFHDKLNKEVFPKIKKEMQQKGKKDVLEDLSKLIKAYGQQNKKNYQIKFEGLGKKEQLFHKAGTILTVNKDHPAGKLSKPRIDRFLLSAILILSNTVAPEDMEAVLKNAAKVQKDLKTHG
ncbi:MAG: hypothetical protein C4560_11030 [Nitrospiraceae bacterium]|nr:MAG: hypothetical protein C4560_11030 [Nitrospiraceae bacterium]